MCDDLNTPRALAAALVGLKAAEREQNLSKDDGAAVTDWLDKVNRLLGIVAHDNVANLVAAAQIEADSEGDDAAEIESLIEQRNAARAAKDWSRADELRDELAERGIELKDGPEGTTWKRL